MKRQTSTHVVSDQDLHYFFLKQHIDDKNIIKQDIK